MNLTPRSFTLRSLLLASALSAVAAPPVAASPAVTTDLAVPVSGLAAAIEHWRAGDTAAAMRGVDAVLAARPSADAALLEAQLLDAQGETGAAVDWYRKAGSDPAIARRLAMIAGGRRPDTLVDYARTLPPAAARRVGVVLALLGRPAAAMALYGAATTVVDHLRLAEWALAAGDTGAARTHAWQAFGDSRAPLDRRYALALLVEAYRDAGELPAAAAFLARHPGAEITPVHVDLLLELGRIDAAIALLEGATDPALRARLTGVLALAGRTAQGEAEYRRLIAAEPHQPQWYNALAAHYLARGDEAQALAVYDALFAANRGRSEVLVAAARQMIAMGLYDQAVARLTGTGSDPAAAAATHLFLFETWLDRGDRTKAAAELAALRNGPQSATLTADIADGYERLGQPGEALALLERIADPSYDRQVRLAELAEKAGRPEDALTRWQSLWNAAGLPARRSYVERQIVRLAKALDRVGSLADAIDRRLAAGALKPGEIDLLVALRLAQDQPDAATAAIRLYAARSGQGEATTLRQIAALQARAGDHDALDATLQRLAVVDPARRDLYLRQTILGRVRFADDRASPAALDALMRGLDAAQGAEAHHFRATVYQMASLDERAIDQFRAALAQKPDDGDALLQLAAALKKQQRGEEARALLQSTAERGPPALFATAIDGLVDLLAGDPANDAALGWTERMVLERIAATGEEGRLLGLLADVAEARSDGDLQRRALEATLATAGDQRPAVLRQLVTLAAGSNGDGSTAGPQIGDPKRRIVLARRLLALGKAYPPDFYADLGRTLLAQGDEAGAERAFAMMNDLGGMVNVDAAKGAAYAAEGRPAAALANYGRALLRDQNDLDLIVRTSILRERAGEGALASRWYWHGLRTMIARQPALAGQGADDDAVDVKRYYPTLVEGLLLTWPADATAMRADLGRMFDAALAEVDPARPGTLAAHRRLGTIVDLGHRIADAGLDRDGMVAGWDARLARLFAADAGWTGDAAWRRHLTGSGDPVGTADGDWPIAGLRAQAGARGNDALLLALALSAQDMATVRALTLATLARETEWRAAMARGGRPEGRPPDFVNMLLDLMELLPADRFRDIVLAPLAASPIRDDLAFDLFRAFPDRYDRLEAIAGAPLLSQQALLDMTVTRSNSPLGFSVRSVRRRVAPDAWMDHFTPDQQLRIYDDLVTRMTQGGGESTLATQLVQRLLAHPLDAARQARLLATLARDMAFPRDAQRRSVGPLLVRLLVLDAAPANRALLTQVARQAVERFPDAAHLPTFLDAWFRGDRDAAFGELMALAADVAPRHADTGWLDPIVAREFADRRQREIDAFLADPHPDRAQAAAFHQRFVLGDSDAPAERRAGYYAKLLAVDPGNASYVAGLLALHAAQTDWAAVATVLRPWVAAHRDDRVAATMLAVVLRVLDRTDEAAAVAKAAEVDPDDADAIVRMLNRANAAQGGMTGLFAGLYDAWRAHSPDAPVVRAVEARRQAGPDAQDAPLDTLPPAVLAAAAKDGPGPDPDPGPDLAGALRGAWRDSLSVSGEDGDDQARLQLAQTLASGPDAIVLRADTGAAVESWLRVMEPAVQARAASLYDLVARGIVARDEGAARLAASTAALHDGADAHAVRLFAALADRSASVVAPADVAALAARLRTMPAMTVDERVLLARVLARGGDTAAAGGLLRAALMQMLYPLTPLDSVDDAGATAQRIVDALALWRDRAGAAAVRVDLTRIVEDKKRGASGSMLDSLPAAGAAAGG